MIVGQRFRIRRGRQRKRDSMTQEERTDERKVGDKKSQDSSEIREQEKETYITLANGRE